MNRTRRDTVLTVGLTEEMVAFTLGDSRNFNVTAQSARKFARLLCDAAHDAERLRAGANVTTGELVTVLDGCEWESEA